MYMYGRELPSGVLAADQGSCHEDHVTLFFSDVLPIKTVAEAGHLIFDIGQGLPGGVEVVDWE